MVMIYVVDGVKIKCFKVIGESILKKFDEWNLEFYDKKMFIVVDNKLYENVVLFKMCISLKNLKVKELGNN